MKNIYRRNRKVYAHNPDPTVTKTKTTLFGGSKTKRVRKSEEHEMGSTIHEKIKYTKSGRVRKVKTKVKDASGKVIFRSKTKHDVNQPIDNSFNDAGRNVDAPEYKIGDVYKDKIKFRGYPWVTTKRSD
tara:strand:+ start:1298 stop:1684 length:387 start_codon:yes stop_codon:yes gene_type:complete